MNRMNEIGTNERLGMSNGKAGIRLVVPRQRPEDIEVIARALPRTLPSR